jgi:hypothetical protein
MHDLACPFLRFIQGKWKHMSYLSIFIYICMNEWHTYIYEWQSQLYSFAPNVHQQMSGLTPCGLEIQSTLKDSEWLRNQLPARWVHYNVKEHEPEKLHTIWFLVQDTLQLAGSCRNRSQMGSCQGLDWRGRDWLRGAPGSLWGWWQRSVLLCLLIELVTVVHRTACLKRVTFFCI